MPGCYTGLDILNVTIGTDAKDCGSIHMLWQIFGGPIDTLSGGTAAAGNSNLVTLMIGHFDWVMFVFPVILYIYIIWHGVIGSANEGKFGGRELAHWMTPIRMIIPPAMLFPIKGGFCALQMFVMYAIMVGVNLANYVWHSSTSNIYKGFVPTTPDIVQDIIEQKIGLYFVYGAIASILNENNLGGQPLKKATQINVWSSGAPAKIAVQNLRLLCNKLLKQTYASQIKTPSILSICENNVAIMSGTGKTGAGTTFASYHSSLARTETNPYDVWISVGSKAGSYDGMINDNGTIAIATESDLKAFLAGDGSSANQLMTQLMGGFDTVLKSAFGPGYTKFTCANYSECSFAAAADTAETYLIQQEASMPVPAAGSVPGTGLTCLATCRSIFPGIATYQDSSGNLPYAMLGLVNNEPVPGISTQTACTKIDPTASTENATDGTNAAWTTQCYQRSLVYPTSDTGCLTSKINPAGSKCTPLPKLTYTAIAAEPKGHQWWNASTMYLSLTQLMSQNINKLIEMVSTFQPTGGDLLTFTATALQGAVPTVYYQMGVRGLSNYIMGKTTGVGIFEYSSVNYNQVTWQDSGQQSSINGSIKLKNTLPGPTPPSSTNGALDKIAWNSLVNCYKPILVQTKNSKGVLNTTGPEQVTTCFKKAMSPQVAYQTRTLLASDQTAPTVLSTGYPEWLSQTLAKMPVLYQRPMKILVMLNLMQNPSTKAGFITNTQFIQYLLNITKVLAYNHAYPSSALPKAQVSVATNVEISPAKTWLNNVFSRVLGHDLFSGQSSLLSQIYSLGNADLSGGSGNAKSRLQALMNMSFNTIGTAQRLGIAMINTVTSSLMGTYQNLSSQFASDASGDRTKGYEIGGTAMGLAFGGDIGGTMGSTAATIGSMYLEMKIASQMFSMSKEMMWMPIVLMVLTSLFTAGISFSVILPLLPFFIFWGGQIAWVLSVIEAMVATPLIVLGLMAPGGHQHFGHTLPGLKMLFGVIFRPVLMVMGLLVAMVLTFILIRFSSQAFQVVATQILSFAGDGSYTAAATTSTAPPLSQGIVAVLLLFTFCSFMMLVFNKCFSIIYLLPEKVLQWIGGAADKAGQQEAQEMSQGMGQTASSGAQAGGSSTTQGAQASQQNAQSQGKISSGMGSQGAQMGGNTSKGLQGAHAKVKGSGKGSSKEDKGVSSDDS